MKTMMVNTLITPTMAKEWLEKANKANPKSRESRVPVYAERIKNGTFNLSSDTPNSQNVISFDDTGALTNGVTRLKACVLADASFRAWVIRGVDRREFVHTDNPENFQMRQLGQMIAIDCSQRGKKAPANLVSVAQATRLITSYFQNDGVFSTSTGHEGVESCLATFRKHPMLEQCAHDCLGVRPFMSVGVAATLLFAFGRRNKEEAARFFRALASGSNLESDDPLYLLRQRLIRSKSDRAARLHASQVIELTIHVWNAHRAGRKMHKLPTCGGKVPVIS